MKKILIFAIVLINSFTLIAQKTKPIKITKPNSIFLQKLQQAAKSIAVKPLNELDSVQRLFVVLLKTASNASIWDKSAYKKFTKNATPIIKALGITSDPDDGGEIFSDPDDGGEIFASSKLITKALNSVLKKSK